MTRGVNDAELQRRLSCCANWELLPLHLFEVVPDTKQLVTVSPQSHRRLNFQICPPQNICSTTHEVDFF